MNCEETAQFYSVNNGQYFVKKTETDGFYILTESRRRNYAPALADECYDILSGCAEITEEAVAQVIRQARYGPEKEEAL